MSPFFSIVTVCKNNADLVLQNIQSVQEQTFRNFEHIVQDGSTHEADKNKIASVRFSELRHFHEPDHGIYHALNLALRKTSGEYIVILHADDFFPDESVLLKVHTFLAENGFPDIIYGDLWYVDSEKTEKIIRKWKSGKFRSGSFYYGWMPPHPALVVRKSVYDRVGNFMENFQISGDYEWMIRTFVRFQYNAVYFPQVLVWMRTGGISNQSLRHHKIAWMEECKAWHVNHLKPGCFTLLFKKARKVFQYI